MNSYIAFFDVDYTILNSSSGKLLVKYNYNKGKITRKSLIFNMVIAYLCKNGVLNTDRAIEKWAMRYNGVIEKDIIELSGKWFDDLLINHIREDAKKEIEHHKKNNGKTVLLSAALPYICDPISEHLEMDDVICTNMEIENGIFSGRILGKACYGIEKLHRVREYCNLKTNKIDNAYYYADSIADIHVLEKVENPVCVTPDKKLRRIAQKRSWRICDW